MKKSEKEKIKMKNAWKSWTKSTGELAMTVGKAMMKGAITAVCWLPAFLFGLTRETFKKGSEI